MNLTKKCVMMGILWCSLTSAMATPHFQVEGISSYTAGELAYEISASSSGNTIKSRLEFPLDATYAGLSALYNTGKPYHGIKNISLGMHVLTNITDPDSKMKDYDWLNGRKIGDTSSDAKSASVIADIFARGDITRINRTLMRGLIGYRYENHRFDIYGLDGYYMSPLGDGSHQFIADDIRVLEYEMTQHLIYGGAEGIIKLSENLIAQGQAILGLGYIEDKDNHLLRGKISTSQYIAASGKLSAHLTWYFSPENAPARFYVKGGVEYVGMAGSGKQDQKFDDGSEDYKDIDSDIEMQTLTAMAMIGCKF